MWSLIRVIAFVLLLNVIFWTTLICSQSLDLNIEETKIGQQINKDKTEVFSGSTLSAPPPGTKPPSYLLDFTNGNFELITNVTSNITITLDATAIMMISNWLPGGAGIQIIQSSTYQMSNFAPASVYAIHLNNPRSTGNHTQGLIASYNFTWSPKPATLYTVHFDCARLPDEPLNLYPALKVSSMSGSVVNYYTLQRPRYNVSDTPKQITWVRHSFVFMGTGAATNLQFESMSENYGPVIDNVAILRGVHDLNPNSAPSMLPWWQHWFPIFIGVMLVV